VANNRFGSFLNSLVLLRRFCIFMATRDAVLIVMIKMLPFVFLIPCTGLSGISDLPDAPSKTFTIIASAETHAMLKPCDCPEGPGGGFAERATILKNLAGFEPLLLDAGGFAGGGIYDSYTEGRSSDSLRTITAIRAMAAMRYDAVNVGDEELQYGARWLARIAESAGLPLVSANCYIKGMQRFVPASTIIVKNGTKFGITGCVSPERLFSVDDSCMVENPFTALRKVWKELVAASDCQVILSHLGEEAIPALVDSFPETDIIVNGHRKTSHDPAKMIGKTLVMQFGYEGKLLSLAQLALSTDRKAGPSVIKGEWLPISRGTAPDAAVVSLFPSKTATAPGTVSVYDLYIMSQCDYGREALGEFLVFTGKVSDVQWKIWFIGQKNGDSLISLHGAPEVNDEMIWLAVEELFPGKWPAFLALRSAPDATTSSVVTALNLDTSSVKKWIRRHGRQALADHYLRSMRLSVTASPTLYINNTPFDKPIESLRLFKKQCGIVEKSKPWCDSLPSCFDNEECRKKGYIGLCGKDGTCSFTPDQPFVFSVVIADSTFQRPEKAVIATTEELFPAVSIKVISRKSPEGRKIIKACNPDGLPFYRFGPEVAKAHHFSRVESGLQRVNSGLIFKKNIASCNYFLKRKVSPGSVDLLVDPVFPDAMKAVTTLLSDTLWAKKIHLVPVIYADPSGPETDIDEKIRREEALRWLVLDSFYRADFKKYLIRYARDVGSSQHWLSVLLDLGIDQTVFSRQVRENDGMMGIHWQRIRGLQLKEPIAVLINNRELVPLRNQFDLDDLLLRLRQR
jgi:hypothetical protein